MIYKDRFGNRIETSDATTSRVIFWPQGGGFRSSVDHDKFHELFKPEASPPTFRKGTVTAEWFATDDGRGKAYPCWSSGDLWNGWGMPYFSRATIDAMLADSAPYSFTDTVKWVDGKLMVYDPQEDQTYEVAPLTVPGCDEPLYGLGAGSWTWDQIEFTKET